MNSGRDHARPRRECITADGPRQESEGGIVVMNRVTTGERRPPANNVFSSRDKEIRLDDSPTTEKRDDTPEQPLAPPEVKSGVTLPQKVSELRRKLGQKAKQEPKFRFYALYDRIYRLDVLMAAWSLVFRTTGLPGWMACPARTSLALPGRRRFPGTCMRSCGRNATSRKRSNAYIFRNRMDGSGRWAFPRSRIVWCRQPPCWSWNRSSRPIFSTRRLDSARASPLIRRWMQIRRISGEWLQRSVRRGSERVL